MSEWEGWTLGVIYDGPPPTLHPSVMNVYLSPPGYTSGRVSVNLRDLKLPPMAHIKAALIATLLIYLPYYI